MKYNIEYAKYMEKSLRKILIMAIVCFVLSLGSLVFYFCFRVEPVTDRIVIELGEPVSKDLYDYITGMDWAIKYSNLDLSKVTPDAVGDYEAYLTHSGQKFRYDIIVQDTTPPQLSLKKGNLYLKLEDVYPKDTFVDAAEDISGEVTLSLVAAQGQLHDDAQQVSFAECGTFAVEVVAQDPSGNITRESVDVIVDTPPTIEGMSEYYIAVGNETDYLQGVTASDTVDGDVTASVEVNLDTLDINTPGAYEIKYTVMDSYGLAAENAAYVNVMEKMDLQEAINTHEINRHEQVIVGAYNLYDAGYYEEDNVKQIREEMEPAFVQISYKSNQHGSGFIIEITDEYVLLCTNQHVVAGYKNVTVYFHEGSAVKGETVGTDKANDIALVKVPMENVSKELLDTLKTVHINKAYWDDLGANEQVSICMRCINSDGTVWRDRDGKLLQKKTDTEHDSWKDMSRLNMSLFSGCSGSAILDGHGNLIAMARGRVTYYENGGRKTSNWGVHLPDILSFYEKTMGKEIYYQ